MGRHRRTDLTDKEREVFKYLAEGKLDSDIASIQGVTVETVRHRVFTGVLRMGAETRCHAIAMLIKKGSI
jgi:DNA-binding CsgD family transcriptional regulator